MKKHVAISMTNIENNSGKLLGYLNLTRDSQQSETKEMVVWSLTIPEKTWSLYYHKMAIPNGVQYLTKLKQASMTPKSSLSGEALKWESCGTYDKQERSIVEAVLDILPSLNDSVEVKASLHSGEHSVVAKGRIMSGVQRTSYKFLENFEVESTFIPFKLKTHSVYEANVDDSSFHHQAFVTHIPSQSEASNSMDYRRMVSGDGCKEFSWKHDIRSYFFDSWTRASRACHSDSTDLQTLKLQWHTNSSYWKTLEMRIDQIFDDIHVERTVESCNISFSNSVVNVSAEWDGPHKNLRKTVLRTCKSEDCQNVKFFMKYLHNGEFFINLDLPGAEKFSFERNASNLKLLLESSSGEKGEIIELSVERPGVWRAKLSPGVFPKMASIIDSSCREMVRQWVDTVKDPQHPLNEFIRPTIQTTTLHAYLKESKQKIEEILYSPVFEILNTLHGIYNVPVALLHTLSKTSIERTSDIYNFIADTPLTKWIIDKFPPLAMLDFPKKEDGTYVFEIDASKMFNSSSTNESEPIGPLSATIEKSSDDSLRVSTFDGLSYSFVPSGCSFLMAYDLKTSLFAVTFSGTSLQVLFPEVTVTVDNRNHVSINGRTIETPLQFKHVRITSNGVSEIEIRSPTLRVECKRENNFVCSLELDYWSSGKTLGLLGNADGLWQNEYTLPDGSISSDILEFLLNYEVSGKQECREVLVSSSSPGKFSRCDGNSVDATIPCHR